jgi:hypothetical protein
LGAVTNPRRALCLAALILSNAVAIALAHAAADDDVAPPSVAAPAAAAGGIRVEARSSDLLAVGIVRADHLNIRLSRISDNAPVHDASVTVVLRGNSHPTIAQADGSYALQSPDLALPGAAVLDIRVAQPTGVETLTSNFDAGAGAPPPAEEKNGSRQLWWWVLNFGVCIGFLWLFSRRKKTAED